MAGRTILPVYREDTAKMKTDPKIWGKTIFWGIVTTICYAVMFSNTELILHMAHTTLPSCIVEAGRDVPAYLHKLDVAACTAKGGHAEPGHPWHVALPILIALVISFVHGAFTGLFWEAMGLRAATQKGKH